MKFATHVSKFVKLTPSLKRQQLCSLNYTHVGLENFSPGDVVDVKIFNEENQMILDVEGVLLFLYVPKKSQIVQPGIIESADWSKQFMAIGKNKEKFLSLVRECLTRKSTTQNLDSQFDRFFNSQSVQFIFGSSCIEKFKSNKLIQDNKDEFVNFLKHKLSQIYQCEPRTNIRMNTLSLIDTQSILNTKHSLAGHHDSSTHLPTLQMFKRRDAKLEWKNIITCKPQQYENIVQRPRDIFALWFAITNARVIDDKSLVNHSIVVILQMLAVSPLSLYPLSTRRSTNSLAAMNFDNPIATIKALEKRPAHNERPDGIEYIFLGQPLETGVNGVTLIQRREI